MGAFSSTEMQARIDAAKALLAHIEAAVLAFDDPTVSRYVIDTGQTVQTVERRDLTKLLDRIPALENRIETLYARMTSSGGATGAPAW
jgi:hypothetical protein